MPDVVTLTMNPTLDVSTRVDRVVPDRKLRCTAPRVDPGGGGLNVARVAHELGVAVRALWTCGGEEGTKVARLLDERGVLHDPVPIESSTRQAWMVRELTTGRQFRFGLPGPSLRPGEAERCLKRVRQRSEGARFLVVSGSLPPGLPPDFYQRVIQQVPSDVRVVADTSGEALKAAVQAGVHLLKPNLNELATLAGGPLETDDEIVEAARAIVRGGGALAVLVSLGAGGAMLVEADEVHAVRAPTVRIRSRVGAGDSTVGGLVAGLVRGLSLRDAARLGVAAGAATVMTEGTELCRRSDVERLFRKMGP